MPGSASIAGKYLRVAGALPAADRHVLGIPRVGWRSAVKMEVSQKTRFLMKKCLIVGRGGYGDLFPLFSIGEKLRERGWHVSVAAEAHHRDALAPTGIPLFPVDVSEGSSRRAGGVWQDLSDFLSPSGLEAEFERVMGLAQGIDLILGNQGAGVGRIVSKVTGVPWVFCPVSPLALLSLVEPPLFPVLAPLQRAFRSNRWVQRTCVSGARAATSLLMQRNIALQKRLGVWDGKHPRFEGIYSNTLNLMMVSKALVGKRPDWPVNTLTPGFAWFNPTFLHNEGELRRLQIFLEQGRAPVVIAPGGSIRTRPAAFFQSAIRAVKALGLRAIVVAAKRFHEALPKDDPQVLVCGYLPYPQLLKGASLLIHSGGIGAIGWSIRMGIPSLILPADWDQFDNAEIASRAGVAGVIWRGGSRQMAAQIEYLLTSTAVAKAVSRLRQELVDEDGGEQAALAICQRFAST